MKLAGSATGGEGGSGDIMKLLDQVHFYLDSKKNFLKKNIFLTVK